jgi:pimeloyl-ACP methyl ester carboxylesterase
MKMGETDQHLTLSDGKQMCWAEYGDSAGEPVFLFHGNPGSRLGWGAMPHSPFVPGTRIVAPDRPGYGQTEFKRHALERWPADVAELADHLGIDRFGVFGPSGGAPYALACAWQIPERLTSVGVFGAVGPYVPEAIEGVQGPLELLWRIAKPLQWVVRVQMWVMSLMARRNPARFVRKLGSLELGSGGQSVLDRPEILRLFSVDFPEAYRQGGLGSAYDTTIPANWPIPLEEIHGRILLWHAEHDPLVGNMTLYLAEHLEDADLRVLPREGHLWILDHMPEVVEALRTPAGRFRGRSGVT